MPDPKGNLVTPIGIDAAGNLWALLVDAGGRLQVDIIDSGLPGGAATEATLEAVRVLLTALPIPIGAAEEATLATRASEATLELVRLLLVSLAAEDFATETTLAALLTELELKADLTETQPVSAAALPLPLGAAISANQVTIEAEIAKHLVVDRTPIDRTLSYDDYVGAHGETARATYTVPGGQKAIVWAANHWNTPAGTAGFATSICRINGNRASVLLFEHDTPLSDAVKTDSLLIQAIDGDVIDIATYSALDDNAAFRVFVHITEFT